MSLSGGTIASGISWCPDHAATDTNTVTLVNGVLFPYNSSLGIYHCPADRSTVQTFGSPQASQLRNRSYNMSQSVNGYADYLNSQPHPLNSLPAWRKFSEIRRPMPSELFVFIDEHPETLLDAQFGNLVGIPAWPAIWFDMPADRHNQGACLSFADGHAERWRWRVPKIFKALGQAPTTAESPDYDRVQHAMRMYGW